MQLEYKGVKAAPGEMVYCAYLRLQYESTNRKTATYRSTDIRCLDTAATRKLTAISSRIKPDMIVVPSLEIISSVRRDIVVVPSLEML